MHSRNTDFAKVAGLSGKFSLDGGKLTLELNSKTSKFRLEFESNDEGLRSAIYNATSNLSMVVMPREEGVMVDDDDDDGDGGEEDETPPSTRQ